MLGVNIEYAAADAITVANLRSYRQSLLDMNRLNLIPEDAEDNVRVIAAIDVVLTHFNCGQAD